MLTRIESERRVFGILSAIAFTTVVVLSFMPSNSVDPIRVHLGHSTDIGHYVAYALLSGIAMLAATGRVFALWRCVTVAIAVSLIGLAIELLQPLVGRTSSIVDLAENEVGIVCGFAILHGYRILIKNPAVRAPVGTGG